MKSKTHILSPQFKAVVSHGEDGILVQFMQRSRWWIFNYWARLIMHRYQLSVGMKDSEKPYAMFRGYPMKLISHYPYTNIEVYRPADFDLMKRIHAIHAELLEGVAFQQKNEAIYAAA